MYVLLFNFGSWLWYRSISVVTLFVFVLASVSILAVPSLQAQSLEERVERLEQQLDEQESSSYPSVDGFGGRVQSDWTFNVDESDDYENQLGASAKDGFEFRRVWLNTSGSISENVDFKVQAGISNNVSLKDVYINVTDIPVLPHLKIGKFKEPYSLSEQTSSKYLTFLERPNVKNVFSQGRNPGFLTSNQHFGEKINWAFGVFTPDNDGVNQPMTEGDYNLATRVTSPIYANSKYSQLVHLGLSLGRRSGGNGSYDNSAGPEVSRGGANLIGVDIGDVENSDVIGLELATVAGPFSLQGEYSELTVNRTSGDDPALESSYLMGSYFLTGERRPYDAKSGSFGRVQPNAPFKGVSPPESGAGAWEVAARWSNTDFTDATSFGLTSGQWSSASANSNSKADILTAGLNWYPTAHTRWMLNYVDAQQDDADVDAQWVSTRVQYDF